MNSRLELNPVPARDAQRDQTNLVHTRTQGPHRDRDRTVFEHLLWRYVSAVFCHRDRVSGVGNGISPLGGGHHLPNYRAARTYIRSDQIRSVAQLCLTLCNPMNRSTPGLPVHHQLPEFTQTYVHLSDAIQPSHPLLSPSPLAPNPSQYQSLFQ